MSIASRRRALVVGVVAALAVGALSLAATTTAAAAPSAARPGVVAAGSPSSARLVPAAANSAPCFQASAPICSSTDPLVTYTFTGGVVGCTYSVTMDWGDGMSTTQPVTGVASGDLAATFTHPYEKPRVYNLNWVSTVTDGDCYAGTGNARFTLVSPGDVPKIPTTAFAGYAAARVADGGHFKAISAVFKVPPVYCEATPALSFAYHWIGLGDGTSVEQAGVADFCGYPTAGEHYYAWWALEPSDGFELTFKVDVGDTIDASVDFLGKSRYEVKLVDFTNGRSFSETKKCTSTCANEFAYVLSEGYNLSPWSGPADFARVDYSHVRIVDSANREGTFDSKSWQTDQYYATRGNVLDMLASNLDDDGAGFYVEWDSDKG